MYFHTYAKTWILSTFNFPASFSVATTASGVPQNGEALVGFHEDALTQAAMGKAQIMLALVLGFGLAAECSEITILGYIMPAAELQLCIGEHRKGWLGMLYVRIGSTNIKSCKPI